MARCGPSDATPALASQRLSDLLRSFPAAAISGVQWQTLVKKYEEQYKCSLDVASLGHDSPLGAVSTLLFDVARLVDTEDTDNPVVAVEDAVAMTPRPGACASWPSLYQVLSELVCAKGAGILVSQLKPLLQAHWHADFDEAGLSHLSEGGSRVRFKKMKHLLQALLRWREERIEWQRTHNSKHSSLDLALRTCLALVPSTKHNDLMLVCAGEESCCMPPAPRCEMSHHWQPAEEKPETSTADTESVISSCSSAATSASLQLQIEALRQENEQLRCRNTALGSFQNVGVAQVPIDLDREIFDDPFEPPPELQSPFWMSPAASRSTCSEFSLGSGSVTPMASSQTHSGCTTPGFWAPAGQMAKGGFGAPGQMYTAFVPTLFLSMGDRTAIPSGMVQQARAIFERGGETAIPSFFAQH